MPVTQTVCLDERSIAVFFFSLMRQTLKYEAAPWGVVEKQTCLFWKVVPGQMEAIRCLVPFGSLLQAVHSHMRSQTVVGGGKKRA